MKFSWNKILSGCLILFSNVHVPAVAIETLLPALDALQHMDNKPFDRIILIYDGDNEHFETMNDSFEEDMYNAIFRNAFQGHVLFRSGDNTNYTQHIQKLLNGQMQTLVIVCLLYTSDAADE